MRREFPQRVRAGAMLRCGGRCEGKGCGAKLTTGAIHYDFDHELPDGLGGDPTLDNCLVLCKLCHKAKTARDVGMMAKADRCAKKHLGIRPPSRFPNAKGGRFKTPLGKRTVIRSTGEPA